MQNELINKVRESSFLANSYFIDNIENIEKVESYICAYFEEVCNDTGRLLSIEEFIEDIEKGCGWDEVFRFMRF